MSLIMGGMVWPQRSTLKKTCQAGFIVADLLHTQGTAPRATCLLVSNSHISRRSSQVFRALRLERFKGTTCVVYTPRTDTIFTLCSLGAGTRWRHLSMLLVRASLGSCEAVAGHASASSVSRVGSTWSSSTLSGLDNGEARLRAIGSRADERPARCAGPGARSAGQG